VAGIEEWVNKMNRLEPGVACLMGQISYFDALRSMVEADVLLVIDAAKEWSPFMPGKLADYYGTGGVVLAMTPHGSSTESIIKKYGGILVYSNDSTTLCNTIEDLIKEKLYTGRILTGKGDPNKLTDFAANIVAKRLVDAISALPINNRLVS
jgi:hypothetical protein